MRYQDTNFQYIKEQQASSSFQQAQLFREHFCLKPTPVSNAFRYKRINGSLSCSVNFSVNLMQTSVIAEQAVALLDRLLSISTHHKRQTSRIECYLYSPDNQVHVLSFGVESHLSPTVGENDWLIDLVKTRINQLKLMFPVKSLELSCEQSETLTRIIQ